MLDARITISGLSSHGNALFLSFRILEYVRRNTAYNCLKRRLQGCTATRYRNEERVFILAMNIMVPQCFNVEEFQPFSASPPHSSQAVLARLWSRWFRPTLRQRREWSNWDSGLP